VIWFGSCCRRMYSDRDPHGPRSFTAPGACAAPVDHGKCHLCIIFDFDLLIECEREAVPE
jgi:hypothetical protein